MSQTTTQLLHALGDFLAARREPILAAWRKAADADPAQTTGRSLTRGQFNDHIPQLLDVFERKLRSQPCGGDSQAADIEKRSEEGKHGLHRWQQGYRLLELIHEWGHLQLCLFEEVGNFAAMHPQFDREAVGEANRQMITLVNEAISESTGQYERLHKAEAAGRVGDLEHALAGVAELERRRAAMVHQAVHDLRSDVHSVSLAAQLLHLPNMAEGDRAGFTTLVQQGVLSLSTMVNELMELARLEAGQERREIAAFNAAALITESCDSSQPFAKERSLYLHAAGPPDVSVEGDPSKVRRLLKNLVLNALKYTQIGGVTVSWGREEENWWLMVKDTGPGLLAGSSAPMIAGLKEATASARESDEKVVKSEGKTSQVLTPPVDVLAAIRPPPQPPGEGIGLSIVKRLCELLNASIELASSAQTGSTFRVVFPRDYRTLPSVPPGGTRSVESWASAPPMPERSNRSLAIAAPQSS